MRSCLAGLVLLVVLVGAALWVALPIGAGVLVLNALGATGFSGSGTAVDVSANPPFVLLLGHADSVHVRATDANLGDLQAGTLDVSFGDVDLFARRAATVAGTLGEVEIATPGGDPVTAAEVTFDGSGDDASARLVIPTAAAEALAESRIKAQTGLSVQVGLATPDRASIGLAGGAQDGTLVVRDGALVLIPSDARLPSVALLEPGSGNPFRLSGASVTSSGLELTGTVDVNALLS